MSDMFGVWHIVYVITRALTIRGFDEKDQVIIRYIIMR